MRDPNQIVFFDTTLRDGEQSPGCTMHHEEKLRMAHQLRDLGVDILEAGFAIASEGDFAAVNTIAREVTGTRIASLARCKREDIDAAGRAIQPAKSNRIHIFLASSDLHLEYKLRISREQALDQVAESTRHALQYTDDVEFSTEDGTRSDPEFLVKMITVAVQAGATTINIPDTVGYTTPAEYEAIFRMVRQRVPGVENVVLSTHCHNDLGMAVANSLAGIQGGARQVECTINGIGERAGNAALEEIVMAMHLRRERLGFETGIRSEELYPSSRLLTRLTGVAVQPNKAVVGDNAFAHEAGIHQDGMLKNSLTYEIMSPATVGAPATAIVLGKHSGRHALAQRYEDLGYALSKSELDHAYELFCGLADRKKRIYDEDLIQIANRDLAHHAHAIDLRHVEVQTSSVGEAAATVDLDRDGEILSASAGADDAEDAVFAAIDRALGLTGELAGEILEFSARGEGTPGSRKSEVSLRIRFSGREYSGRASAPRSIEGAA